MPGGAAVAGEHLLRARAGPADPGGRNEFPGRVAPAGGTCQAGRRCAHAEPAEGGTVAFAALITWFAAVLVGLFMLAMWLIENDATDRVVAPSRLPVVIIFAHLFLAAAGLAVWVVSSSLAGSCLPGRRSASCVALRRLAPPCSCGGFLSTGGLPGRRARRNPLTRGSPSQPRATSQLWSSPPTGCSRFRPWC
jgi:hypothetical protein